MPLASSLTRITRGKAVSSGLKGRASQPRKPQTKRVGGFEAGAGAPRVVHRAGRRIRRHCIHRDRERKVALRWSTIHRHVRLLAHAGRAREHVRVPMRKDNDVPCRKLDRRLTFDDRPARPFEDHVIGNHVLGAGKTWRAQHCARAVSPRPTAAPHGRRRRRRHSDAPPSAHQTTHPSRTSADGGARAPDARSFARGRSVIRLIRTRPRRRAILQGPQTW